MNILFCLQTPAGVVIISSGTMDLDVVFKILQKYEKDKDTLHFSYRNCLADMRVLGITTLPVGVVLYYKEAGPATCASS